MKITELHFDSQIKRLQLKIKNLLEEMKTTEEKCLSEYERRINEEGLKKNTFISKDGTIELKVKRFIICSSETEYKKIKKNESASKNFTQFGPGIIKTDKHAKNTRGNNATIETVLGAAITYLTRAILSLKKEPLLCLEWLSTSIEAYGSANGRFQSKVSPYNEKIIQNEEIRKIMMTLRKNNPKLSKIESARKALSKLGYPRSMLSRARRL